MNLKLKKEYYNICNSYTNLGVGSDKIIDIDNFEIDGRKVDVRGRDWANEIVKDISWSDSPEIIYFTGYSGSGKTTELMRVIDRLSSADKDANLLPVYINATDYFNMHDTIELTDIFTVIVHRVIEEVALYQGKSLDEVFGESGFFGRLWSWLRDTDVTLEKYEVGAGANKLVFNIKETLSFRKKVRQSLKDHFQRYRDDVLKELDSLNNSVKNYQIDGERKDGILVVIDQLEKIRGVSGRVEEVKEAMEQVFADRSALSLPIDVIYTIPPYLSVKKVIDNINFLPVVKVVTKDGDRYDDGIAVMREFIYRRVPKEAMREILGEKYDELLEYIILSTGGYPRDFLITMQNIIQQDYPVSKEVIDKILKEKQNDFAEFLTPALEEELRKINESNRLSDDDDITYELFNSHAIFRYRNDDLWYSLHPSVKKLLGL